MNSPTLTMRHDRRRRDHGHRGLHGPEQARGKTVDKRADIWAFGVVAVRDAHRPQMFAGDTVSDVLAAVVAAGPGPEPGARERPANARTVPREGSEETAS